MNKILLVEDDAAIVRSLTEFLRNEGFDAACADGQQRALELLAADRFDLALIDVSLREGNGFSLCMAVKQMHGIPVIFLTAADDEYSVVTGLELGGDDYVSKPFRPRELVTRIKTVLRRTGKSQREIEIGGVRIDLDRGAAYKNGEELALSALEYRLLLMFFNNKGIALSRSRLLAELWDLAGDFVNDNTLTVYIKRLRDKIEDDPANPVIIRTVRGVGYKAGD